MQCIRVQQIEGISISPELIGTYCIADDKWYGKYKGIIVGPHKSYGEPRISVQIVECLRPPSTVPEYYPQGYVHRKEYQPGEIHHFSIKDVIQLIEE